MRPLMLCIHMEKERALRLAFIAMSLGIAVKTTAPAQEGQTLAALCGLEDMKESVPAVRVEEEMLLLAFLPDDLTDRLLHALRAAGLRVGLKAVLTPVNRAWNCGQLYHALAGEAAAFARQTPKAER